MVLKYILVGCPCSLNFPLAYYFYVVFRTLLPFIFFSSVFEAFDWPHWGSPEQLPWEIALQNLDRLLSPQPFSLIKTPLMLYGSVLLPRPLILTSQNIKRVTCPPQYKINSLIILCELTIWVICLRHCFLTPNWSSSCNTISQVSTTSWMITCLAPI